MIIGVIPNNTPNLLSIGHASYGISIDQINDTFWIAREFMSIGLTDFSIEE
jgi:hypothetical protein